MKVEAAGSFETLATTHQTTVGRIPEDNYPCSYRCDNLKFHIISVLHQIWMKWAGHVTCMGEIRNACNILVETQKRRDISTDVRIMLEGFLKEYSVKMLTESIWRRIGWTGGRL
jgi:hypothetical protein